VKKAKSPKVLFNASVILAALHSPRGGSGLLLKWAKQGKLEAFASEVILDETIRNLSKLKVTKKVFKKNLKGVFTDILPPPDKKNVYKYRKDIKDIGDAHLFATADEVKADFLVSLDKKHVLSLKNRFKKPKIVNPEELIMILRKN
jgi:putative PIN family toxin of toxin-antitoxin system